ncbi:MAG: hypothetical protein V4675_19135 [Verrucomicrobiota bacterium]
MPQSGEGDFTAPYQAFLQTLIYLPAMNVPEDSLLELWGMEKKLWQLLHADSAGSPTWFLDACGQTTHPRRRLLLSNYDMGVELESRSLQLGLNFAASPAELFPGTEMGEDALRLLGKVQALTGRIHGEVRQEAPLVKAALKWAKGSPPGPDRVNFKSVPKRRRRQAPTRRAASPDQARVLQF